MKKIFVFILVCSLSSCLQEKGSVVVENGNGEKVSIPYEITDLEAFRNLYSLADLRYFAEKSSEKAKYSCKHEPTYEPKEIGFRLMGDTLVAVMSFTAKNGFGVPDDLIHYYQYKGKTLIYSY